MLIGLTGNIGSGKTSIARIFRKHGFRILDADRIAHRILGNEAFHEVIKQFGNKIITRNKIDRKKLGRIVFSNKSKLDSLSKIIWPYVIAKIKSEANKYPRDKLIVDAALLIESGLYRSMHKIILVKINPEIQIKRLLRRKKHTKEIIEKIIVTQLPQDKKEKYADYVIENSGSYNETKTQVAEIVEKIIKSPASYDSL